MQHESGSPGSVQTGLSDHELEIHRLHEVWQDEQNKSKSHNDKDDDKDSKHDHDTDHKGISKITHGIASLGHGMVDGVRRRIRRMHDVIDAFHQVKHDLTDTARHPELLMDAELRRNNDLCLEEAAFLDRRKQLAIYTKALHRFLQLPDDTEVHPDDIPVVAVGGSGGGYRACLGYLAMMETLQSKEADGLWELIFYAAGVSGSCWSLGSLFTIGQSNAAQALDHFAGSSKFHPLSGKSVRAVASSPRGVYFQLGPIIQKIQAGVVQWTPLDLYATLTTTHILLCRTDPVTQALILDYEDEEPGKDKETSKDVPEPMIQEGWLRWSSVIKTAGLDKGMQPLPLFTACRHERPWRDWKSDTDPFDDVDHASKEHDRVNAWWQWFEVSPFETGSDELEGWIPTWSFGRPFKAGKSDPERRLPEQSLSMLLGATTSAVAGPLSAYIETIARNLPHNSIGNTVRSWGASWAKKHPESERKLLNHHPIHALNEPNPFFGHEKQVGRGQGIENSPRIHLVDAGMGNNLPTYVFFRPHRTVDVALLGDYSSDVQKGAALDRIREGGLQKGLDIRPRVELPQLSALEPIVTPEHKEPQLPKLTAEETEDRFKGRYAQVLDARPIGLEQLAEWQKRKEQGQLQEWELDDYKTKPDGFTYNDKNVPLAAHPATLIYLPLLPNKIQPEYDPATAPFSSSYNLSWTPEQVRTIRKTGNANTRDSLDTIRSAVREAYERRRAARLQAQSLQK